MATRVPRDMWPWMTMMPPPSSRIAGVRPESTSIIGKNLPQIRAARTCRSRCLKFSRWK